MTPDQDRRPDDDWLSTSEAADLLGVTVRRLYRLIDEGQAPAYRMAG